MKVSHLFQGVCLTILVSIPVAAAPSLFNLSQWHTIGKPFTDNSQPKEIAKRGSPRITPHVYKPVVGNVEKRGDLGKRKGGGGGGGGGGGHASSAGHSSSSGHSGSGGHSSSMGTAGAAGAGALAGGAGGAALAHQRSTGAVGADLENYNMCLAFAIAVGIGVIM